MDEKEVTQAHAANLADEAQKEKERKAKLAARKREWRAAKKAALEGSKAARAKGKFDDAQKITVLVDKNPKRPGTIAHRTFEKYRTSMTVADFLAKGGAVPDLLWDVERKFIKVG